MHLDLDICAQQLRWRRSANSQSVGTSCRVQGIVREQGRVYRM